MTNAEMETKPVAEDYRPELTQLPVLSKTRLWFRGFVRRLCLGVIRLLAVPQVDGLENFPQNGPALIVTNHLGDADMVLAFAFLPERRDVEIIGKIELNNFPIVGTLLNWYGVIWIHRGRPDRQALKCALSALQQDRIVAIAPEGRYSLTHALETGMNGAAYLAYKSGAPLLPVTFVGTENEHVFGDLRKFRRPRLRAIVGPLFYVEPQGDDWRLSIEAGTQKIMQTLADQLPSQYRGVYQKS